MMLTGRIQKEGALWRAECAAVGAFTQGNNRKHAAEMLADCIEAGVKEGFRVRVVEVRSVPGEKDAYEVSIDSDDLSTLLVEVLKHQRRMHKLTLAEVAKRLGSDNVNAYAAYEQGKREPSVGKFREMLAVVAPELGLTIAPREVEKRRKVAR